ncbi:MAG: amidohydrolase family protein [Phormidesmis sp.]
MNLDPQKLDSQKLAPESSSLKRPDLKIENATLVGYRTPQTITIQSGLITEIAPSHDLSQPLPVSATGADSASNCETIEANRKLVIPSLIDPHLHLDKALLLEQHPAQQGTFAEALADTAALKQNFTLEDIQSRARRVIENEIAFGTTTIRTHVEVDPILQLTSLEAILPLKQAYTWGVDLQLAIFAQEGITNQPGTEKLLHQALSLGGDLIGSAPYTDTDPIRNIQIVFDLAQTYDCDVDFHLDFLDNHEPLLLPNVIKETVKRGWQNRVCLGHMTRLAGLLPAELSAIATDLKAAGISILALPASDLYMMARQDTHNVRRGVAPVHTLTDLGVNCAIATNNVQNLFTPFGDGDPLKICTLLAQVLQLGTPSRHAQCLEMATTRAARAIGINNHSIAIGHPANLVILDARTASEAVGSPPVGRMTFKAGKLISRTDTHEQLIPH